MIADYRPTDQQIRTGLDALTGVVVISVAMALAGLTWRIAGHADSGAVAVTDSGAPITPAADLSPATGLAPFGAPKSLEAAQPTGIDATLTGLIYAQPQSLASAFIKVGSTDADQFSVGDSVSGAVITAIQRDRVMLTNSGRSEYLAFPDPSQPEGANNNGGGGNGSGHASFGGTPLFSSPTPSYSPPTPSPAPGPTPSTSAVPSDSDAATDAQTVMSRFGATAVSNGYQIGKNPPAGLEAGDVIKSVNGQALSGQTAAESAFAAAARSGSATVQIVRSGKTITLTVPVR